MGYKEERGLFKMQLDQNPWCKLVILSKRGSDMKKAAGSVTTIISISNTVSLNKSNPHPNIHTHTALGHKNADW